MSREAVVWRLRSGQWARIHPGVYTTFTGPVSRAARLWAIVLYAGPQARLSHQTAAELNGLPAQRCPVIHVTIPAARRVRPPQGVVIHRASRLSPAWQPVGLPPHTFVDETVIDLVAAAADLNDVIALLTTAFGKNLVTDAHLRREAADRVSLRWRRELDEIITAAAGGAHSPLEYRHDRDVQRAHGLPEPVKQARFRKPDGSWGYRDRCYPQYGALVVELDGQRFHPAEERGRDTERDNQAAVAGATLRYGWDAVTRRSCETARQLAAALRHRGWTGTLRPCSPDCRAVPGGPAARPAAAAETRAPGSGRRGVPVTGYPAPLPR